MAEWSKALVLGTSLSGGVGSNPTAKNFEENVNPAFVIQIDPGSITAQSMLTFPHSCVYFQL